LIAMRRPRSPLSPWLAAPLACALLACQAETPANGAGGAPGAGGGNAAAGGATSGVGGDQRAGSGGASSSTGGRTASGGSPGAGGAATGGTGSGGNGTTGAGGGGAPFSGLPTPPGGGVARPSGTPGNLTVVSWAGFRAAVSYTFDDTNSSQIMHYDDLQALRVPLTFYLITGKSEATNPVWMRALADGHELGNHTQSHLQAGTAADVDAGSAFLQRTFGITVWTMASPYGDASYPPLATTRYLANRGVANGLIAPNDNTDPFNLFCYVPPAGALAGAFNTEIDAARSAGRWKIVLVHGFTGGTDGAYQPVSITEFTAGVTHAKSFGDMWIDTVTNVAAYWRAQKLISALTPAVAGSTRTWTWTLPAHFPPGKFLRVRVDGGTLAQGGAPLAWSDHGYYEVALDPGSLTLAP
jgi:peptidoglycan/xylan/chitin deacetylase (PgdA/CDA1 family)